jgi:hypothetical protein
MGLFKHEVSESTEVIKKRNTYTATVEGYIVILSRDDNGLTRVSIGPKEWHSTRMGLIEMWPKSVADIEILAAAVPGLFKAIAAGLREVGLDDLRSDVDISIDDSDRRIRNLRAAGEL